MSEIVKKESQENLLFSKKEVLSHRLAIVCNKIANIDLFVRYTSELI